jgi:hypothetical protein
MLTRFLVRFGFPAILWLFVVATPVRAQLGATVSNWPVPTSAQAPSTHAGGIHALGDVTNPIAFIGVTPCRVVDTRGANGTFGGPSLSAGSPRNFPIPTGPCAGIPANAQAYSLNVTATNTAGPGFIKIFPQGGPAPVVSTLNYIANQTVANAAIVPAGTAGGITVAAGVSGTDLILDINGYYGDTPNTTSNQFKLFTNSTNPAMTLQNSSGSCSLYCGLLVTVSSGAAVSGVGIGGSTGLLGTSFSGSAVYGVAGGWGVYGTSLGTGLSVAGVWGTSTDAIGTYGFSTHTNGVWAQSGTFDALAAFGGRDGGYLQGARNGVVGVSAASTGSQWGVLGQSQSTTGAPAGVRGVDSSGYLPTESCCLTGVLGDSQLSFGVLGRSEYTAIAGYLLDTTGAPIASGILGTTFGTASNLTTGPWGVFSAGDFGAFGAKNFVEPDPVDPTRVILYASLEGPEVGTYLRGTAKIKDGRAVITLPEHFRTVTHEDGMTVQLTPVGAFASMYVESEDLTQIIVRSSADVTFHYLVQGVRRAFRGFEPVSKGNEFMPRSASDRMPAYLTEEARRRLIANGTYNEDGTVNMRTAERLGWTRVWEEREARIRAAAERAAGGSR